jgi:diguanylate cyclase (GGDEF)-like protein
MVAELPNPWLDQPRDQVAIKASISELRRQVISATESSQPEAMFRVLIQQAQLFMELRDYAQALSNLFEALHLGIEHGYWCGPCYLELARIAFITDDKTQSSDYAEKAIEGIPIDSIDLTRQNIAIQALELQHKIALEHDETGKAKFLQRQIYSRLIPLDKPRETLLAGAALLREQIKDIRTPQHLERSLLEYEKEAEQICDRKPLVELHIAHAILLIKFTKDATQYIHHVLQQGTQTQINDLVVACVPYLEQSQQLQMLEHYQPLLQNPDEYIEVLNIQSSIFEAQGKFDLALDCHKRIIHVSQVAARKTLENAIGKIQDQFNLYAAGKQMMAQEKTITDLNITVQNLEVMATRDALTNAYNRRYYNAQLEKSADVLPYCVVLLDIDHFKKVNDSFGHDVGDVVLKRVAQILMTSTRAPDVIARYGGEEFAMLLHVEINQAYGVCERIRHELEQFPWATIHANLAITASLGVCSHQFGHQNLLKFADLALYQAKHNGRNQTVIFDSSILS